MKKSITLLLLISSIFSFSQYNQTFIERNNAIPIPQKNSSTTNTRNLMSNNNLIWEEDFSDGIPSGWTLTDNAGIGGWIYNNSDTTYTGAFTYQDMAYLHSESNNNGYMYIPADYYNCIPGVWPREEVNSPTNIDAIMETDWINIPGGSTEYILTFDTWFQICCSESNAKLDINIATIDAPETWTTLNAQEFSYGIIPINGYPNGNNVAHVLKNITSIIGSSSQIKIQFHMHGMTKYHWSIDDIKISSAQENNLSISNYYANSMYEVFPINYVGSNPTFPHDDYNMIISQVPTNIKANLQLGVLCHQIGINAENVHAEFSIDSAGTHFWPSVGSALSTTSISNLSMNQDSVFITDISNNYANAPTFYNTNFTAGDFESNGLMESGISYQINYSLVSTNPDNEPSNNHISYEFKQTNGRYSYHHQPNNSSLVNINKDTGPFAFYGANHEIGDVIANLYYFYQKPGNEFKIYGVRVFIPNSDNVTIDAFGDGVTIEPKLYFYDDEYSEYVEIVDVTGDVYTIQENDKGKYIFLPFDEFEVEYFDFPQGKYNVGFRILDYNNQKIAVGVDESFRQGDCHFRMKIAPWTDDWYYFTSINGSVMIDAYTTLEEIEYFQYLNIDNQKSIVSEAITIYPNPSHGIIHLKHISNGQIKVFSITGDLVYHKTYHVSNISLDLSFLPKGAYVIKVVDKNQTLNKRIILTN